MVSPEMTKGTAATAFSQVDSTGHGDRDRSADGARTGGTEEPLHEGTDDTDTLQDGDIGRAIDELENKEKSWFAYLKTRDFYIVLLLGYAKYSTRPLARHIYDIY